MQEQFFPVHSIIMLVGPANCGKTTFSTNYLMPKLQESYNNFEFSVHRVSSDEIRQELLGLSELDKQNPKMQQVNVKAFDLLKEKVDVLASYPNNSHYIIVDSTGLNEEFRQDIKNIAKEHNYYVGCVVFNYKSPQDYFNHTEDDFSRKTINRHRRKLKEDAIPKITNKAYHFNFRITNLDFENITINTTENYLVNYLGVWNGQNNNPKLKDGQGNVGDWYWVINSGSVDFGNGTLNFVINDYVAYTSNEKWEKVKTSTGKEKYVQHQLSDQPNNYVHIGDIHGCYDEFKELLIKLGFKIDENDIITYAPLKPILLGDFVDKGTKIKETIEFIYKNLNQFYLIKGNHENFIYQWFIGNINTIQFSDEFINAQFNTINILENDDTLKRKFFEIFNQQKEFFQHDQFIVTHVPAPTRFLGKIDKISLKEQQNLRIPKLEMYENTHEYNKAHDEFFNYLRKENESSKIYPINIFGHITTRKACFIGSRLNIDSACVDGNVLTGVIINGYNNKSYFEKIHSKQPVEKIPEWNFNEKRIEEDIDLNELEPKEKGRILHSSEKQINFISGTMSPANAKDYDLESLQSALDYYKYNGINEVVLQPKYMGSRCTIYLHKNLNECFGVSRKGYVINHVDLTPVFEKLHKKLEIQNQFKNENVKMLILDSELLPWNLLGANLIDRDFKTISNAVKSECEALENEGFEEQLQELNDEFQHSGYADLKNNMKKEKLKKEFGASKERTYRAFYGYYNQNYYPLQEAKKDIDIFDKQVKLYGDFSSKPYAKPFSILKTIYNDDSEKLHFNDNNDELFEFLNDDGQMTINLNDDNAQIQAETYFQNIIENMEGVVVKPKKVFNRNVAPFLKVRNKDYLTLVYGFNYSFKPKYDKLLDRKKINGKLRASIEEFEIGKRMLEIPYKSINKENQEYINLFAKMIGEEKQEEEMDPRL